MGSGQKGAIEGSGGGGGGRHKKRVRQPHNTAERQRQKAVGRGEYIMDTVRGCCPRMTPLLEGVRSEKCPKVMGGYGANHEVTQQGLGQLSK